MKTTRTAPGIYEATIAGLTVRVTRTKCGTHRTEGSFSRQPNRTARVGSIVVADGNGTLSGAVECAAQAIEARGMGVA